MRRAIKHTGVFEFGDAVGENPKYCSSTATLSCPSIALRCPFDWHKPARLFSAAVAREAQSACVRAIAAVAAILIVIHFKHARLCLPSRLPASRPRSSPAAGRRVTGRALAECPRHHIVEARTEPAAFGQQDAFGHQVLERLTDRGQIVESGKARQRSERKGDMSAGQKMTRIEFFAESTPEPSHSHIGLKSML
jgi:hypothetical protein